MSGQNEMSFLEMSDEDMLKVDPASLEKPAEEVVETAAEEPQGDAGQAVSTADEGLENQPNDPVPEANAQTGEDAGKTPADETTDPLASETGKSADPAPEKPEAKQPETPVDAIDYKAAYEKLTAPFKANGREIQVTSVEDAIALMQMGANYNKKMAGLKPNLKLLKMLEGAGLLNEEKLSYLIDLEKKNPEAISKLIKDSGLDPLDLDAEKAGNYMPTSRKVDDRELELDAVLDEIQDTPSYTRTIEIVSQQWDEASKSVIANSPQLLKVINQHVQSGIYDQISKEMETERMFGRLSGLSDLEAYRQVGDAIQARGGFNHLSAQVETPASKPVVVQPKPKMGDEDKRREKKLAAAPSKTAAPSADKAAFNPLALSDDEFSKVVNQRFL